MKFPSPDRKRVFQRGSLSQTLMFVSMIAGVFAVLGGLITNSFKMFEIRKKNLRASLAVSSGVETLLVAYRFAEMRYITAVNAAGASCSSAKPFLQALKEGAGCPLNVTVFNGTDEGTTSSLYSYPGPGCVITASASTCAQPNNLKVLSIGELRPEEKIGGDEFSFYLTSVLPGKRLLEFSSVSKLDGSNTLAKRSLALRPTLANSAHIEANGRITQEKPDPLSRCPGTEWADFLIFSPSEARCMRFVELGGGTGLAYYNGRYFGFRPADGQVIDMIASADTSANPASYLVQENGYVGSTSIFPPHNREALRNADDITTIRDQIYYVAGLGEQAHIGVMQVPNRVRLCELGAMGWGQAYAGLTALSWSDPLVPTAESPDTFQRFAVFYAKTDSGDLLTAVIQKAPNGGPYSCFVQKDANLQEIEFKRTYGFDRAGDPKPYLIY